MDTSNTISQHKSLGKVKTSKNSTLSNISIGVAIFLAFCSMQPWFVWNINALSLVMLLFVAMRIHLWIPNLIIPRKISFTIFIFLIFGLIYSRPSLASVYDTIRIFITVVLPCIFVFLFSQEEKNKFIKWFITIFSLILIFSIPAFLLHQIGISTPHVILVHPNPVYKPFENHFLFITSNSFLSAIRFKSIYTEPGHLGMMCAILLYVNRFTLRDWRNVFMLIALLWSLSLGGYVLLIIGFILYKVATTRKFGKSLAYIPILLGILSFLVLSYDENSTDVFSVKILSRMQFDSETGIAGNNRNTDDFDQMYERFSESSDYLLGISKEKYDKLTIGTANSSYKNFILANGIVATVLLWVSLFLYLKVFPSKLGLGLIILLIFSFLQRPYIMWSAEIYTAICAIPIFHTYKPD